MAVIGEIIGQQHRPAGDSLKHPHVDVVSDAAVEDHARRRISARHLIEKAATDERLGIFRHDLREQVLTRARKHRSHEGDVILLLDLVLAMHRGIARKRQPDGGLDAGGAEQLGPIALSCKNAIKTRGLLKTPFQVQVSVNRPPRARPQLRRQVIPKAVIDIQVEIERVPGDLLELIRPEVLRVDQPGQCRRQ